MILQETGAGRAQERAGPGLGLPAPRSGENPCLLQGFLQGDWDLALLNIVIVLGEGWVPGSFGHIGTHPVKHPAGKYPKEPVIFMKIQFKRTLNLVPDRFPFLLRLLGDSEPDFW